MNFASLLEQQAAVRPHGEALVAADSRWSFAAAAREVRQLAAGLRRRGVGPGDRVAVVATNRPEYLLLAMAVYRIGGVLVPINFRLTSGELQELFTRSGAAVVASEPPFLDAVSEAADAVPTVSVRIRLDDDESDGWTGWSALAAADGDDSVEALDGSTVQRIMFTSGTTNAPKGVVVTHDMAATNAYAQVVALDVRPGDRILVSAPLHHVGGSDLPGLGAWLQGATLVLQPRFDPDETLRLLVAERITGTTMVQTMLHLLRHRAGAQAVPGLALRWVLFGALPEEVCGEVGALLPGVRLIRGYGMTETMGGVAYLPDVASAPRELARSCGWPLPFVEVRTVDPEGRPTPAGVAGEIVVRGAKVTRGYWRDEVATSAVLVDGWLHTGDVGVMAADGSLRITDRLKDMIRSGGENISSAEVEHVLYEHPAVVEAAVVAMPHERWVEVPKAFVVLRSDARVSAQDLIDHCRGRLAKFKVPAAVTVVDELPRTASGKVLKTALRRRD